MTTEDILARLIAFPTVSADSNLPLIDWVEGFLNARGFRTHRVSDATGQKAGLFAALGPEGPGGVMLSAHSDVVPVEGQDRHDSRCIRHRDIDWARPPEAETKLERTEPGDVVLRLENLKKYYDVAASSADAA